ncbi:uncharacterized protein K02A2.6-like [Lytechinus variegatus]|uniref:uncharacterized protein K02A2.6-like n=1 Tax=Lytechinus variegatus TaxID=7654 RepID=UPI001BB1FD8F|nr:uncharacterized protein K02A2.6-like [Lytechinus variegatus]
MEALKPPQQLDLEAQNLPQVWALWKEELMLYLDLAMADKEDKTKVKMMLYLVGSKGRELYQTIKPATETLEEVVKAFDNHCNPPRNETVDRFKFFTRDQQAGETFDTYLTALKLLAANCNFSTLADGLLRDRIVCGIRESSLRERLLRETALSLEGCIQICRASELTKSRMDVLDGDAVHAVRESSIQHSSHKQSTKQKPGTRKPRKCRYCGQEHEFIKEKCPAYGKQCARCGKYNHFKNQCKTMLSNVHGVSREGEEEDPDFTLHVITLEPEEIKSIQERPKKRIFANMMVRGHSVRFQVDCGATCNVLPSSCIDTSTMSLQPTKGLLSMYNMSTEQPMGKCTIEVVNPKNQEIFDVEFIIVDNGKLTPILGSETSQLMGLITVQHENIMEVTDLPRLSSAEQLSHEYSDVFDDRVGKLPGQYKIELDPTVKPVVHPPRRVPVAIKERLKAELVRLVEADVVAPVDTPTEWVSSLVCVNKPNNKLRVCLDPQDLNKAVRRNHYPMKIIEDILPDLSRAKVFSVVDAKNGFWHVELEEDSSYLTTFNTPFGRYRWKRLPFGIASAPEEFQRRLDEALEGLQGVRTIADDILVYGEGDTMTDAEVDHDTKLRALMERCREKNLKLNKQKLKFKRKDVSFMGHLITEEGLKPDPAKVKAVRDMQNPTDVAGVQRFLGFVNYLSKFLPNLSEMCEPLRSLTKKDVEWCWLDVHDAAVKSIKEAVTSEPVLRYFDKDIGLVLQADASEKGLGAAILQKGQPIAYTSRALTEAESRYAQIEKELLAVTFGLERFHQYTYGRKVTVQSDHKPLEIIAKKNMHQAPKRLQRLILRLQTYDADIIYHPGKQMYIADTLSRAYLPVLEVDGKQTEMEQVNLVDHLPIARPLLEELKQCTAKDEVMQEIQAVVMNGWPMRQQDLPSGVIPYFHIRDELSIANGLIFRGERVVIPKSMRQGMIERLHASHLGESGCLKRARECLYWPNMNSEVKNYIQRCDVCRAMGTRQQKEPLKQHEIPERPWAKVGADLFVLDSRDYLVITDYYSNFIEVDYLTTTTSSGVIHKMKAQFARHGIPEEVVTDNGPQFTSDEFAKFGAKWEFKHTTTSPLYPQANGKVENAVKTAKSLLKKAKEGHNDPYLSLLAFRNTPTPGFSSSPVQRLMNRRTRTTLPTTAKLLEPAVPTGVKEQREKTKEKQAHHYNRSVRELPSMKPGDVVRIQPHNRQREWRRAKVLRMATEPHSYVVMTEDGATYRRNRRHLRLVCETWSRREPDDGVMIEPNKQTNPDDECDDRSETQERQEVKTRCGRTIHPPAYLRDFVK